MKYLEIRLEMIDRAALKKIEQATKYRVINKQATKNHRKLSKK